MKEKVNLVSQIWGSNMKIDFENDIEILKYNHNWWLYSNERDRYLPTDIADDLDENVVVESINNVIDFITENDWIDYIM